MADASIVIVDPSGHEHEFPAGFDPQRAAAIVKQNYHYPEAEGPTPGGFVRNAVESVGKLGNGLLEAGKYALSHEPDDTAAQFVKGLAQRGKDYANDVHPTEAGTALVTGHPAAFLGNILPVGLAYKDPVGVALDAASVGGVAKGAASAGGRVLSTLRSGGPELDRYMPNTPATAGPVNPGHAADTALFQSLLDRMMPNTPADAHPAGPVLPDTHASLTPLPAVNVDRYMPNIPAGPSSAGPTVPSSAGQVSGPAPSSAPSAPPVDMSGLRNMLGSERAAQDPHVIAIARQFGIDPKELVQGFAPGPSRTPLVAQNAMLDSRLKHLMTDERGALDPAVLRYILEGLGAGTGAGVGAKLLAPQLLVRPTLEGMLNTARQAGGAGAALTAPRFIQP